MPRNKVQENNVEAKRELFNANNVKLVELQEKFGIYLSRVDLENDLDECIHNKLVTYLNSNNPVKYLQVKKYMNMNELVNKLTREDCKLIYNHKNFKCLKGLIE